MTADPPKKRRWFQVHLSTAIALMLVSAVLVWANMRVQDVPYENHADLFRANYGWPLTAVYREAEKWPIGSLLYPIGESYYVIDWEKGVPLNCSSALAILAATAFACEWLIRRRERKYQEPQA